MTCPHDGDLRAWIDAEPSDYPGGVGRHAAECVPCRQRGADLRRTADISGPALALLAPSRAPSAAAVETALSRVRALAPSGQARRADPTVGSGRERFGVRLRRPLTAAAAVALAFSLVGTPAGRSAASEFLAHFRSEHFAAVTVNDQDAAALSDLQHLGTVSGNLTGLSPEPVGSIAVASRRVGFAVAVPDSTTLPAGLRRTPEVMVSAARELRFTFDSEKATQWVEQHGGKALPERFDGASLVVSVPAAVVLQYASGDGSPGLVIGQARSVEAHAEGGVSFEELRRFLLDLPGLSAGTRAQLAAIGDWRTTLPLPIPAGQVRWQHTSVAGVDGLLLGDNTGLGSAVLWQRDGRIYGVAAPTPAKVVRDVAVSLR